MANEEARNVGPAEYDLHVWNYWRSYYGINRQAWPSMSRPAAAWDAFKLSLRIKGWLRFKGPR